MAWNQQAQPSGYGGGAATYGAPAAVAGGFGGGIARPPATVMPRTVPTNGIARPSSGLVLPAQIAQPATVPGGGASGCVSGGSTAITVTGGNNVTLVNIINGQYVPNGENHGKPVFKKVNGDPVLIYYWDERDGPTYGGWWFGPKVGGDQVWAHNSNTATNLPPLAGWKVPWDGPVDATLQLSLATGATGSQAPNGGVHLHPSALGGAVGAGGPSVVTPGGFGVQLAAASQAKARQIEMERQQQEAAREAARQRATAVAAAAEAERKKREDEERERQRARHEENMRREAEMKRRREEDEKRRNEQNAALAVRKVIQRVRIANPDTYDDLRNELEDALAEHLEAMGNQAEKISQEAEIALKQAQQRIDDINRKREEDERRAVEEEQRKKDEADLVERTMKELNDAVNEAEAKVGEAQEQAKNALEETNASPDQMAEMARGAEKVIEAARGIVDAAMKSLENKREEMGDSDAARNVRQELRDLDRKLYDGHKALGSLASSITVVREKASKKAGALKKVADRKAEFDKFDKDRDGQLSRDEVRAFASSVYDFDCPSDVLDKVVRVLSPVAVDKFQRMRYMVAIAKSEAKARAVKAAEDERKRIADERYKAVQAIADEASDILKAAEISVDKADEDTRPLSRGTQMSSDEMRELASSVEATAKEAKEHLEKALTKIKEVEADCGTDESFRYLAKRVVPSLEQRHEWLQGRIEKAESAAKAAGEKALRQAVTELEQWRSKLALAIRTHMSSQNKTIEVTFKEAGSGESITKEQVLTLLGEIDGGSLKLPGGCIEKIFADLSSKDGDALTFEGFQELLKLFYRCVKSTVISETISIKSKTVRRLEVGEVLVVEEGPSKEDGPNILRVRCTAVNDHATGWSTIAGNQGTPFLEIGGNMYEVMKETMMTDGLSLSDSKTVRRVSKGEIIEVLEFVKKDAEVGVTRIRGKAKSDGLTGWVTISGNQGTNFLEPC